MNIRFHNGNIRPIVARNPVRKGKTAHDHASGSWKRRLVNREARAMWQQDNRATNDTFPG